MFLLDTNVISALAPTKARYHPALADWVNGTSSSLYLSVVTGAEITAGIAKAEREGAITKAARLKQWWAALAHLYADRILPIDMEIATAAGHLLDRARAHDPGFEDIAIAATAQVHGLTVLTRNLRHFRPLGVSVLDPTENLPTAG